MRVAIGELYQETCINSPVTTERDDFNVVEGTRLFDTYADSTSEIGGFLDAAREADDIELVPTFSARASPNGPVSDPTYERFADELVSAIRGESIDGVVVALHGAMMTPRREDPEGELLSDIGDVIGDKPLIASIDPHAHVTPRMVDECEALVAYQTTPHVDIYETGQRTMTIMADTLRNAVDPTISMVKVPTMISTNQYFLDRVQEIEAENPDVLSASFSAVQAFVDAEDMGHLGLIVTDADPALADRLARDLAEQIWDSRTEGTPVREETRPTVSEALQTVEQTRRDAPYVFIDDGDHMCGGAPGDSPVFLRALMQSSRHRDISAAIHIVDPDAVERLATNPDGRQEIEIGGKITTGFSPESITGEVIDVATEPLIIRGELYAGTADFFGTRVTFKVADRPIWLVLTENSGLANDPPFFEEHGIDVRELDLVVVQCLHNVADYEPFAAEIIRVKSPGVTAAPYQFVRKGRPIYPLDEPEPTFKPFNGYWQLKTESAY